MGYNVAISENNEVGDPQEKEVVGLIEAIKVLNSHYIFTITYLSHPHQSYTHIHFSLFIFFAAQV